MASGAAQVAQRLRQAQETRVLDLSCCELVKLPDAIYLMLKSTSVTKCTLSGNMITKIPNKFPGNFTDLIEFDVSKNRVSYFPPEMHAMQKIEVLNMSANGLESIPMFVYELKNLRELHLQDNCITGVEVSRLEDIESLSLVNLQNNPISDDLKSQLQSCKFSVLLGNDV